MSEILLGLADWVTQASVAMYPWISPSSCSGVALAVRKLASDIDPDFT